MIYAGRLFLILCVAGSVVFILSRPWLLRALLARLRAASGHRDAPRLLPSRHPAVRHRAACHTWRAGLAEEEVSRRFREAVDAEWPRQRRQR